MWPLLVGRSGTGSKGAGWSAARRLITSVDPDFAATNIRSGPTSGVGLAFIFAEDDEELQRLITTALDRRNGVRFVLALALGTGQGESIGLKWPRLNSKTRS